MQVSTAEADVSPLSKDSEEENAAPASGITGVPQTKAVLNIAEP